MANVLEQSSEVLFFMQSSIKRHSLQIAYRDEHGILREYEVGFIVKTKDKVYLVETTMPPSSVSVFSFTYSKQFIIETGSKSGFFIHTFGSESIFFCNF